MNTFKAVVASIFFLAAILVTDGFTSLSFLNFLVFFISGFIALGIGDLFLIQSFSLIGPGRTMLLFGFQPVVVGLISFVVLGQVVQQNKLIGILFFILCLFTFSYESFKKSGRWEFHGLVYACLGMFIDGVGIIITRYAFDMNKSITGFEGNFYRCLGAIACYILISRFRPINFTKNFKSLRVNSRYMVIVGAFFGTFLSLAFYLEAIKTVRFGDIANMIMLPI
jgi:drug/metabolite transporter (DMT)-like permease